MSGSEILPKYRPRKRYYMDAEDRPRMKFIKIGGIVFLVSLGLYFTDHSWARNTAFVLLSFLALWFALLATRFLFLTCKYNKRFLSRDYIFKKIGSGSRVVKRHDFDHLAHRFEPGTKRSARRAIARQNKRKNL